MIEKMRRRNKGAILIFVLGMLMVLTGLVSVFLSNIMDEVYLKFQIKGKSDLKHYAYNVFNIVWCELEDMLRKDELCSSLQGWNKVLSNVNLSLPDFIEVELKVQDESGKFPLNFANQKQLVALFSLFTEHWDAQNLMHEFWSWKQRSQVESKLIEVDHIFKLTKLLEMKGKGDEIESKKMFPKVFFPRDLVAFEQLEEIDAFRKVFFAKTEECHKKFEQLKACVSLWTQWPININSVSKDLLKVVSKIVPFNLEAVINHLNLENKTEIKANYFKDLDELKILGHGSSLIGMPYAFTNKNAVKNFRPYAKEGANKFDKNLLCTQAQILRVNLAVKQSDVVFHLFGILKVERSLNRKQLKDIHNYKEVMQRKLKLLALSENPLE